MYLKELTIHGFKSFAKPSELAFSTPVTAIVGPNGSGKSNVAEAFRFVLGEQSAGRMRSKKGEDLIWGGSPRVARQNRASVRVVMDNTKKVFPIDYDEVVVERTVHRDGSNEYSINGGKVRLKDVLELFAAANIGATGHHIISQGEADRILSANPKLRREMIEDALGLKVYQYKKAESEKKLEKTRTNIERVESLRRETKPHLQFLERQVKKFERAKVLREELAEQYAEYLAREKAYLDATEARLSGAYAEPKQKIADLQAERAEVEKKVAEPKDVSEDKEELASLTEALKEATATHEAAVRTSGALEGQVGFLERRIEHLEKQHAQKQAAPEEAPIEYGEFRRAYDAIRAATKHVAHTQDPALLQRAIKDILTVLEKLVRKDSARTSEKLDLSDEQAELAALREQKSAADVDMRAAKERCQVLEHKRAVLREKIAEESREEQERRHRLDVLAGEIKELEHVIREIDAEYAAFTREKEQFDAEVQEAVVLVRSRALQYMKYVVKDGDTVLSAEDMAREPRERQRERQRALERSKIRLEEIGGVNDEVLKEHKTAKERDEFLERELQDLTEAAEKLEGMIADLTRELNDKFAEGIEKIDTEFNAFFGRMFNGGAAHLVRTKPKTIMRAAGTLEDGEDIEDVEEEQQGSEGVDIDVEVPNKRLRGLDMMSGGERALTSIALIFAMSQVNPPPFIILDETDAALDEANSRRYGDMLGVLAEKSQLILITHNRETMSRAGVLYGVTMGGDGVSRLLSIQLEDALAVAK